MKHNRYPATLAETADTLNDLLGEFYKFTSNDIYITIFVKDGEFTSTIPGLWKIVPEYIHNDTHDVHVRFKESVFMFDKTKPSLAFATEPPLI